MATRGGYPFGFSLICPAIKHAAESPLADTFYRRASLDREIEREKERDYFICARARLPPETLWRRVFPFASFDSLRPLSGERKRRYTSRVGVYAGFLVARLSAAPGITLIPSLTVFCRGGILALGVGELSRLLTGASENVFEK